MIGPKNRGGSLNEFNAIVKRTTVFGHNAKIVFSYNGDDKLRNLEMYVNKKGTIIYTYFQTTAKLVSSLLRHSDKETVIEKLKEVEIGEPSGWIEGEHYKSPAEYILQLIDKHYLYGKTIKTKTASK